MQAPIIDTLTDFPPLQQAAGSRPPARPVSFPGLSSKSVVWRFLLITSICITQSTIWADRNSRKTVKQNQRARTCRERADSVDRIPFRKKLVSRKNHFAERVNPATPGKISRLNSSLRGLPSARRSGLRVFFSSLRGSVATVAIHIPLRSPAEQ